MSKIRGALLLLALQSADYAMAQVANDVQLRGVPTNQPAIFTAHYPDKPRKPARVRAVNQGPASEPALPENAPGPKPAAVADRPDPVSLRRRKLRLKHRT